MQRYELGRLLGQGTFAKVYYARNIRTSQSFAIKMIDKDKVFKVGLMDQIKREISVMRLVKHPNIVQLYEVMASKSKIYFALEYIRGGELFAKVSNGRLKEDVARKYFQQLISAVDFCHSRGVYHRDLKPENLLLDDNGNLKVSDFGLSALAESKRQDGLLHTTCGTPAYVAPEVIARKGYDGAKADIWSCGVILFVLLAGYLPFHDANLMEMYRKITKAEFRCPNWLSSDVKRLITRILDPNPLTRISIAKIKEHSWFKKDFITEKIKSENESIPLDCNAAFDCLESNEAEKKEGRHDSLKPIRLNAFDIISLSTGFDLSGLFEHANCRSEARFTSSKSASAIISKLEEVAKLFGLTVKKKGDGVLRMEQYDDSRMVDLSIDVKLFEITSQFHLVEICKTDADTLAYQKLWNDYMRPALADFLYPLQGDHLAS
ncbi:hypothetical protein HPP92_006520 [Vanilla planifolia]|uniref:non-specific serine/threonine protein kinase n=1 Tax=Vanilla planifolia TaxID=51239 RepID=A0A835RPD7_VANPL|nr:hypothetical protein HPP92_006520 [Vanilla planifolia]